LLRNLCHVHVALEGFRQRVASREAQAVRFVHWEEEVQQHNKCLHAYWQTIISI